MGTSELLGKPNRLWRSDLRWTSILSRESRNTHATETRIRYGSYMYMYEPVSSNASLSRLEWYFFIYFFNLYFYLFIFYLFLLFLLFLLFILFLFLLLLLLFISTIMYLLQLLMRSFLKTIIYMKKSSQ